jgi:hypothetical protein
MSSDGCESGSEESFLLPLKLRLVGVWRCSSTALPNSTCLDLPLPLILLEGEEGIVTSGRDPEACRDLRRVTGGCVPEEAFALPVGDDRADTFRL